MRGTQGLREGFAGQKMWVIPRSTLTEWASHPIFQSLLATDIGWFPEARNHVREREQGADEHILVYCVDGAGWLEVGGMHYTIGANEAFIVLRGVPHRYGANDTRPWSIHWVHFTGTEADFFTHALPAGEHTLKVDSQCAAELELLFNECYRSFAGGFVLHRLIYCTQVLHHLLGRLFFNNSDFSPVQQTSRFRSLDETLGFLHQNIHRSVALGEMAEHAGLSVSHFSAIFKEQTGYSPVDYFIRLKMQHACTVLSLQDKSVREIALEIGYDDPYYFSRLFKKVIGVPPLHYRKTTVR